jgi:hypothetical protein
MRRNITAMSHAHLQEFIVVGHRAPPYYPNISLRLQEVRVRDAYS